MEKEWRKSSRHSLPFANTVIVKQKMKSNKKILITTETHEILIIRATGKNCIPGLCEVCGSKIRASVTDRSDLVSPISKTENLTPNDTNESNGKARKTL